MRCSDKCHCRVALRRRMPEVRLMTFKRDLGGCWLSCQCALFSLTWVFAVITPMVRVAPHVISGGVFGKRTESRHRVEPFFAHPVRHVEHPISDPRFSARSRAIRRTFTLRSSCLTFLPRSTLVTSEIRSSNLRCSMSVVFCFGSQGALGSIFCVATSRR